MKIPKLGLYILLISFLPSCQKKEALNYSQDKLVSVTMDLYFAGETLSRIEDERADSLRTLYNKQIETIHKIEMPLYEADIKVLKEDINGYLEFHKIIRDTIQVMDDKLKKSKKSKKPSASKKNKSTKEAKSLKEVKSSNDTKSSKKGK